MRIFLLIFAGIVVLVLAVVIIGLLLPKRHLVSRSASYRATPQRLFSLIDGPQTWRPDVLRYEAVTNATGQELMRETTRNGESILYEVLDRIPPTSIKRRIASKNLPYAGTWAYWLQPDGENTLVRITEDGEVYNPVFRFVSHFIIGQTHTMDAYLRALGKTTGQDVVIKD